MGTPIPAALSAAPTVFTAVDHDEDLTPVRVDEVVCIDDSAIHADLETIESCRAQLRDRRRRQMASAALIFMDKARVDLLDADFDPWSVGTPAHKGFADHRAIEPSALQMVFGNTITTIRMMLEDSSKTRPLQVFEIPQQTSVPSDAILLNLLFYLSTDGYIVSPKVARQEDGTFIVSVVAE